MSEIEKKKKTISIRKTESIFLVAFSKNFQIRNSHLRIKYTNPLNSFHFIYVINFSKLINDKQISD